MIADEDDDQNEMNKEEGGGDGALKLDGLLLRFLPIDTCLSLSLSSSSFRRMSTAPNQQGSTK